MCISAAQHNVEIASNREVWIRKPLLQEIYRGFYRQIATRLRRDLPGMTVELGSGMGSIKEIIPDCVTTDLFPNPWLDRRENAYALTFPDGSVANLILFDVWHHLAHPGSALAEFARVVTPGGRLILFEPSMGLLGRFIYTFCHHEPIGFKHAFVWEKPAGFRPDDAPYFAAIAAATRFFLRGEGRDHLAAWKIVGVNHLVSISYVASGGYSRKQLYPGKWLPALQGLDRMLARFPGLFATRLILVLERSAHA